MKKTMKTYFFTEKNLDLEIIKNLLKEGKVMGFPTETVYGLGALISQEKAIQKIYDLKKRDRKKALIVHLGKIEDAKIVAEEIPDEFYELANYFFPGPLTIVLKKKKTLSSWVSPDDTVALRMPAHGLTLNILNVLEEPIIGTSANLSNFPGVTLAQGVKEIFAEKISLIIDGGRCPIGIPSTIINLIGDKKILREGFITKAQIEKVLKKTIL